MRKSEEVLYSKVSKAREVCAGSAQGKGTKVLYELINDAMTFARDVGADGIADKIEQAYRTVVTTPTTSRRIEADDILCSILNNELKGFG